VLVALEAEADSKPETINVAFIGDLSGPYAGTVGAQQPGALDAWKYFNEERDGIKGVKVTPLPRDCGGNVAVGLSQYNELINLKPRPLFIDTSLTPLAQALRERFVEDGIVSLAGPAMVSIYPVGNVYGYYPLYPEYNAVALKWYKDNIWKEKRNLRLGIITWDTSFGRSILTEPYFDYLKSIGVDLATEPQLFGVKDVDVSVQLMNLRAAKADLLTSCTLGAGVLAIVKGCKEMGWDVPFYAQGVEEGGIVLDPPLFEGCYAPRNFLSWDQDDHPWWKTIMRQFEKNNRGKKDKAYFYWIGWINAAIQHEVMNRVVDEYGWDGLNATNITKVMNELRDFAPLDGITQITYSPGRLTTRKSMIMKVTNGKILPVAGWQEVPDLRPAEYKK